MLGNAVSIAAEVDGFPDYDAASVLVVHPSRSHATGTSSAPARSPASVLVSGSSVRATVGAFDELGHGLRVRYENGVAGCRLDRGRSRTLCHGTLLVWRDH